MRVRALQQCFINAANHDPGEVFDIAEENFDETILEEVDADTMLTKGAPPQRAPVARFPESGGREKGVETDNILPETEPEMETHREGGGKKRR